MEPLLITVAGIGAELTKKDTPHLPVTPAEIIAEAKRVYELGAHVFHLHVRDTKGLPTCDPKQIKKVVQGIRAETGLVVQISTGGSVNDSEADRMSVLNCGVDMGSLTLGSVNFGKDVFLNPRPFIEKLAKKMLQKNIQPELEIFDVAMVEEAHRLIRDALLKPPFHFNIILGGPGWLAATPENLEFILKKLPKNSSWSASGVGRFQLPMIEYAIQNGGHVRTGLEDNIYVRKGELAQGNAQLVEQVRSIAAKKGRPIATPTQAKRILGIGR